MSEGTIIEVDVAIVGGGPAGCATALRLRDHAPELSVALIEASSYESPRLGETLPPLARTMLRQLGLLDAFEALARRGEARPVYGSRISWGGGAAHHESYLMHAKGAGWHLDRQKFDAFLARTCEERGVDVRRRTRVRGIERSGAAWRLRAEHLKAGPLKAGREEIRARFVVDAAGRSAPIARRLGARTQTVDSLVAFARYFEISRGEASLTVEADEHGWWYSAGLPDGRAVVVCLSDADLARGLGLHDEARWREALEKTELTAARARELEGAGPLVVRSAASRRLEPAAGENWLAVGDAASVFDPLSSQGLTKSLRSGIFAAYAIADLLVRQDPKGIERYARFLGDEFESYLKTRQEVYDGEGRWAEAPFWRRRHLGGITRRGRTASSPVIGRNHRRQR